MDSLDLLEYGIVEADVAPLSLTFPPWFSCSSLGRTSLPLCSGHAAAMQAGIKKTAFSRKMDEHDENAEYM